mmetsp:Transcript_36643/g.115250  ORF Transcript_36643/g.115250 Transcript_36643/m.115250 type:complete len:271 (-) Transcript_36643:172-984(-)
MAVRAAEARCSERPWARCSSSVCSSVMDIAVRSLPLLHNVALPPSSSRVSAAVACSKPTFFGSGGEERSWRARTRSSRCWRSSSGGKQASPRARASASAAAWNSFSWASALSLSAVCSAVWVCIRFATDCSSLIPCERRTGRTRSMTPGLRPAADARAASRKPSSRGAKQRTGMCAPPRSATPSGASSLAGSIISCTRSIICTTPCVSCSIAHSSPRVESSVSSWKRYPSSRNRPKNGAERRSALVRHTRAKEAARAAKPWHMSSAQRRP